MENRIKRISQKGGNRRIGFPFFPAKRDIYGRRYKRHSRGKDLRGIGDKRIDFPRGRVMISISVSVYPDDEAAEQDRQRRGKL